MMTDRAGAPEAASTRSKQLPQAYPQGACLLAADLMEIQRIQPIRE
ncbi:hypothetical protein MK805_10415 [Shimazuella sp. AN120528]|nr:hypothetical protein [Shimazuella soli]MCH5585375.1 hypothetical protein [Shimazuella soli]